MPRSASDPERLGGYLVLGVLGAGPSGTVYLGRGPDGQLAAVKLLQPAWDSGPDPRPLLRREAEALRRLPVSSPHLAWLLEVGVEGDAVWLARHYVDGPTLAGMVAAGGPLPADRLQALAAGTAKGLAGLHAAGIRHGNLKPTNVLLAAAGPVLTDAGMAYRPDPTVVLPEQVLAAAAWLAPELVTGELVTSSADVHAWGGLVSFAATGRAPFRHDDRAQMLRRLISDPPDLGGMEGELRTLTEAAMAKNPARRPTAPELVERLRG